MEPIQGNVSIDAQNIMPIIKKWLYSDKDIFIREVVSNGCDAITKLRMVDSRLAQGASVRVQVDKAAKELRFIDDGIGMTEDEVKTNINQVAFSGAKSFLEEYAKNENQEDAGIIGHFGLGFYSVFMVSDKVTIDTLSFREGATPVRWESEDGMAFTMTEGTRQTRGTTITLHISDAEEEFLNVWRVREVLERYCSFMAVPIYLEEIKPEEEKKDEAVVTDENGETVKPAEGGESAEGEESKPEEKPDSKPEEKAEETIRLSREEVDELRQRQAAVEKTGAAGKKRSEIKPMKKKKSIFARRKSEEDDFMDEASEGFDDSDDDFIE